jgi:hypothetical protein
MLDILDEYLLQTSSKVIKVVEGDVHCSEEVLSERKKCSLLSSIDSFCKKMSDTFRDFRS